MRGEGRAGGGGERRAAAALSGAPTLGAARPIGSAALAQRRWRGGEPRSAPLTRRALLLVLQGRRAPSELPADSLGRLPERHGRSLLAAGRRAGARSSAGAAEGMGDARS